MCPRIASLWCLFVLACPSLGVAQSTWGPWTFADDRPFADVVTSKGAPIDSIQGDPAKLAGGTPDSCLVNLGYPCSRGAQILELRFTDVIVENRDGHDLVIFDVPYSPNEYEVAVKPKGAAETPYQVFQPSVDTGRAGCLSSKVLLGVPVDVSEFGLADGVQLEYVRIKGDCATNPQTASDGSEIDIAMVAALRGANRCAATSCKRNCSGTDDCPELVPECTADEGCQEFSRCSLEGRCVECLTDDDCSGGSCDSGQCSASEVPKEEDRGGGDDKEDEDEDAHGGTVDTNGDLPHRPPADGCGCRLAPNRGGRSSLGWSWLVCAVAAYAWRSRRPH